jgi:hypothetical protein
MLLLVNLLLCVVLGGYWATVGLVWQPPPPQPMAADMLVVEPVAPAPPAPAQFSETLARPLFSPTRRPLEAAPEDKPAQNLEQFSLFGLFGSGENAGVLLQVNGRIERVVLNQRVAGWTLGAVRDGSAVFTRGSDTRELKLVPHAAAQQGMRPPSARPNGPVLPDAPRKNARPPTAGPANQAAPVGLPQKEVVQ